MKSSLQNKQSRQGTTATAGPTQHVFSSAATAAVPVTLNPDWAAQAAAGPCRAYAPATSTAPGPQMGGTVDSVCYIQSGVANDSSNSSQSPNSSSSSTSSSHVRLRLSLGLSPLYQMDDSSFKHCPTVRKWLDFAWQHSYGMYPFQSLAAAKAKYGGGLHGGCYEDRAVVYQQRYMAHSRRGVPAAIMMFDVGKLLGLWVTPADASFGFVKRKVCYWASATAREKVKATRGKSRNEAAKSRQARQARQAPAKKIEGSEKD